MRILKVLLFIIFLQIQGYDEYLGNRDSSFMQLHKYSLSRIKAEIIDKDIVKLIERSKYNPKFINDINALNRFLNIGASRALLFKKDKKRDLKEIYNDATYGTPANACEAYYIITGKDLSKENDNQTLKELDQDFRQWFFPKFLAVQNKLFLAANPFLSKL